MNGLLSERPSQSAVRLVFSGCLLLLVQSSLLLLVPNLAGSVRALIWVVSSISAASLFTAIVGLPDPPPYDWRRHHGR